MTNKVILLQMARDDLDRLLEAEREMQRLNEMANSGDPCNEAEADASQLFCHGEEVDRLRQEFLDSVDAYRGK